MTILNEIDYKFYASKLDQESYDALLELDPTPNKQYSRWIVETYLRMMAKKQILDFQSFYSKYYVRIPYCLRKYIEAQKHKLIQPPLNDINKFSTANDFVEFVFENEEQWKQVIDEKREAKERKILYKDENTILVQPLSHEMDRKYGTGTRWCTATSNKGYWDGYNKDGALYIRRFLNDDGSFAKEAYQLYIPNKDAKHHVSVECRDRNDDTIEDLDDFFEGIPSDITEDLMDEIDERGGLNSYTQIESFYHAEEMEDHVEIGVEYSLARLGNDMWETTDSGDEYNVSFALLYEVGKDKEIPKELDSLLDFDSFNILNGNGIYLHYQCDLSFSRAEENANNRWHQAERNQNDDPYEINETLDRYLKLSPDYDYFIMYVPDTLENEYRNLYRYDNNLFYILRDYIPMDLINDEQEHTEVLSDSTGKLFFVQYKPGYNLSPSSDWVSNRPQRQRDRQMDFQFEKANRKRKA